MSDLIEVHFLRHFGPSNLVRGADGRPKTATIGEVLRARISSAALKRPIRLSDEMAEVFGQIGISPQRGIRTRKIIDQIIARLNVTTPDQKAKVTEKTKELLDLNGVIKAAKSPATKKRTAKAKTDEEDEADELPGDDEADANSDEGQAAKDAKFAIGLFSGYELDSIAEAVRRSLNGGEFSKDDEQIIGLTSRCVDVGLFGRMLAPSPELRITGALACSHAITVARAAIELDYGSANPDDEPQAGHIHDQYFTSGLFYYRLEFNMTQMIANCGGDVELAKLATRTALRASIFNVPSGKNSSYATRANLPVWVMAQRGRITHLSSLDFAFLEPVRGSNHAAQAVQRLLELNQRNDRTYGRNWTARQIMTLLDDSGVDLATFLSVTD